MIEFGDGYDTRTDLKVRMRPASAVADFTPIEREMVAQARLITNAKYEAIELEFLHRLEAAAWRINQMEVSGRLRQLAARKEIEWKIGQHPKRHSERVDLFRKKQP